MNKSKLRLLVMDVDGTMTDGGIYIDNNGVESKRFYVKDGIGIKNVIAAGFTVLIITGRESYCVKKRAEELGIKYLMQNIDDKRKCLEEFASTHNFDADEIAFIGDDLNDLPAMQFCALPVCPADAVKEVINYCKENGYVLSKKGGDGAIREFCEKL
jgi:3-deoxy-D-manno-octulosonate 8-phosphate phosphatase (KDO 8-P phosphatase)